jgi:predicted nucleotidyltransferase
MTPFPGDADPGPRVRRYVDAVVQAGATLGCPLVSVILFGSAASGGFTETASDLDLILVVHDELTRDDRRRLRVEVERLEELHGFRHRRVRSRFEDVVDRLTGNVHSFFICSRRDLLSGRADQILGVPPLQALFVDRIVIAGIVGSATTVWGEGLLQRVPLPAIRRIDVFKAFQGLCGTTVLMLAVYPVLPDATKYAMAALKRSVHSCFFCYHGRCAALEGEVEFFQGRIGPSRTLRQLLDLRREYADSLGFVARCVPLIVRLHARAAWDNRFPRQVFRA